MTNRIKVSIVKFRKELPEILTLAKYANNRFVITRHGKPVASLISYEDLNLFEELEDLDDVRAAKAALKEDQHATS
jgi:prevent-host-death family protein